MGLRGLIAVAAVALLGLVAAPGAFAADFINAPGSPEPGLGGPAGIATGDVDNDGDQDVVTANLLAAQTAVLINNGTGDFRLGTVGSNAATVDVGLGNFDADSNLDLVLLYPQTPPAAGLLAIFRGNGDGTFTFRNETGDLVVTGVRPTALTVGNFNGDAFSDVAVIAAGQNQTTTNGVLATYIGAGDDKFVGAAFAQAFVTQLNAVDIVFGNFNGGASDLVVSNQTSQSVSFLAGNGTGFAAPTHVAAGAAVFYLDSGNLNGDANRDLVATINASNPSSVRTLFGNGAGGFPTQATVAVAGAGNSAPQQVVAKDFDNDTDLDLAVANGAPLTVSTANNNGTGTFTPAPTGPEALTGVTPAGAIPFGIASADFDGSGFADIAVGAVFSSPAVISILDNFTGPQANLSLSKSDAPDPVNATGTVTYQLTAANSGVSSATTTTRANDTLPAGLTFDGANSSPGCTAAGQVVTCDFGPLGPGANSVRTIAATATGAVLGPVVNTATVSSNLPDGTPANNTASQTTTINPAADLQLTKTDTGFDPVNAGDNVTYQLAVKNNGPNNSTGSTVSDTLPTGLTFNPTGSDPACSAVGQSVTCTFGAIANGATATKNIVASTSAAAAPEVTNAAVVAGAQFDQNGANNLDDQTTTVNSADVSIEKTDSPDPVDAGDDVTYTLKVTNDGPSDAADVEVTDTLPAGLTFNPTGTDADCSEAGGTVTCDFDTVAAFTNVSKDVVVTTDFTAVPSVDNTAEVSTTTSDSNLGNNTDTETTTVNAADLSIDKTDSPDPANAGDEVTYTLEVTNAGPSDAANVTSTDTLPAGLTFDSSLDNCFLSGGDVICDFGTVAANDTETQTFIVDTDSAAAPSVDNTATVGSDTPDPNNANDSDTETTTVSSADLSIDKQDSPDPVNAGDEITYTLEVTNAGPSDAANVTSTDTLPAGLTFDSSLDNCFLSGGDVICDFGTVANERHRDPDLHRRHRLGRRALGR